MATPRSSADLITAEALPYTQDWVRVAQYKKGHKVSPTSPTDARCGAPLAPDQTWWDEKYRPLLKSVLGVDPGPWWVALDTRKGDKCTECKGKDLFDIRTLPQRQAEAEYVPQVAAVVTPAQKLANQRNNAAVNRVARELGATIVS